MFRPKVYIINIETREKGSNDDLRLSITKNTQSNTEIFVKPSTSQLLSVSL